MTTMIAEALRWLFALLLFAIGVGWILSPGDDT
jgi:hypothetical protein